MVTDDLQCDDNGLPECIDYCLMMTKADESNMDENGQPNCKAIDNLTSCTNAKCQSKDDKAYADMMVMMYSDMFLCTEMPSCFGKCFVEKYGD